MHIYCKTNQAICLAALKDGRGVIKVPNDAFEMPGLCLDVQPRMPINEQLIASVSNWLGIDLQAGTRAFEVVQEYQDYVIHNGREYTLYVLQNSQPLQLEPRQLEQALSMSQLLKRLPADKRRLPYFRAWQVIAGGLHLNTKAFEVDDIDKFFE